jgi:hypothetical protein
MTAENGTRRRTARPLSVSGDNMPLAGNPQRGVGVPGLIAML